ncbi:glycosyltransferase [Nocardioides marmoraquaticus]
MRIAQVANFVGPTSGGMRTAVEALGRGYAASGARRLLVVPGATDEVRDGPDGTVVRLRAPRVGGGYRLIVDPWRVTAVLDDFAPDSVEVCDKLSLLPVSRWARRTGTRCVLFSHERLDAMLRLRTGLTAGVDGSVAALNQVLLRRADVVVVTSRFAHGEFAAPAAAQGTPVTTVPLGVDLGTFAPRPPRPHDGLLRLVHLGRLSREKSPQLAAATAAALHRRGVPVHLDVVGDGPHRALVEEAVGEASATFHGHVGDRSRVAALVSAADVALSVCPGETFGLAVLEALACGTPVVTADVGGARELVDAGSGAWGAADPEALADAVLDLGACPREVRERGARLRAEQFGWQRSVDAMLAVHAGGALALSG